MNFSFRYAEKYDGLCYLRYDDTNPEAEKTLYYESIDEMVRWLGFTPYKVTAASDYFQQLYEYAVELIKRDKAYVCHMTNDEIHASRGGDNQGPRCDSPWRNRPVQESLAEFERMKRGEYKEGEATLRLKMDMQSPNPCMWDLVAYRVLYTPHCRTGRQWNIYPMYDFTHCLCDSLENITHSLCTTEFINAREAYYWVCDQLEVYKAVQWEYGRLNITNTVLSKRKLTRLVQEGIVSSWDDPRIYTLAALRRRGFPPTAINRFVEELGITTAASIVDVKRLENVVRDELNKTTLRRMAILDPLKVIIDNLTDTTHHDIITLPNDPRDPSKGDSQLPLSPVVYIDQSDFRVEPADANFFRFTPDQPVGLFKAGVLHYVSHELDASGHVACVHATIDRSDSAVKPKTFVQWVPADSQIPAELRIYKPLFKSDNPDACPGGFLNDINPESLSVKRGLVDGRVAESAVEQVFQFQRVGYFCKDKDSTEALPVFNLTVSIKEDPSKN
jgi:glutaminyl-tRNA synthetase